MDQETLLLTGRRKVGLPGAFHRTRLKPGRQEKRRGMGLIKYLGDNAL